MATVYAIYKGSFILLPSKWFPDDERVLATTILGIASVLGDICSFALVGIVYGSIDDTETMVLNK